MQNITALLYWYYQKKHWIVITKSRFTRVLVSSRFKTVENVHTTLGRYNYELRCKMRWTLYWLWEASNPAYTFTSIAIAAWIEIHEKFILLIHICRNISAYEVTLLLHLCWPVMSVQLSKVCEMYEFWTGLLGELHDSHVKIYVDTKFCF